MCIPGMVSSAHRHILFHLSHLNQWRQYKVHIKYGSFHIGLLTIPRIRAYKCIDYSKYPILLLLHLSYLNQWRQGEVHIKDGCFHVGLLTIPAVQRVNIKPSMYWHIFLHLSHLNHRRQYKGHIKDGCFHVFS